MIDTADTITSAIRSVLTARQLAVPLRQRAKFEGWFKIELAHELEARDSLQIRVEQEYPVTNGRKCRADIAITVGDTPPALVMLKTINTNFRFEGIETSTRPITKNITGLIEDIQKLSSCKCQVSGLYFAAPFFPVSVSKTTRDKQLELHMDRIRAESCTILADGFLPRHAQWGVYWILGSVASPAPTP